MLVRAVGEVDLATVPILWSNLKAMLEDNLNGIQYIDSVGIQALLNAYRFFIRRGQRVVLAEPSPILHMLLLEISGLEKAIPVFASVAAALASLRSPDVALPWRRLGAVQALTNLGAV